MNELLRQNQPQQTKVRITNELWRHLVDDIMDVPLPEFVKRTGLSYQLIYNLVHRRIKSLSARHYRIIFGEPPPLQVPEKVDGLRLRELINLWLYFNHDITKADLYREFYGAGRPKKVDYRIFSGKINAVDAEFIAHMERKFFDAGIDPDTLEAWLRQLAARHRTAPIAYERIRPLVLYLQDALGIHPTALLNQWFQRYESGQLKHVSPEVYQRILNLKQMTENTMAAGNRRKIERLREEIYGRKTGYTLYTEVSEELKFLQTFAHRSPKRYLGRSTSMYERGQIKRLPTWRAKQIIRDCSDFIRQEPGLKWYMLPRSMRRSVLAALLVVLKARTADLLSREEGIRLEKQILKPTHTSEEYKKRIYGFTRFDRAGHTLGMDKKAFDLMVAENCEIFRKISTYERRWYLSDLYLQELIQRRNFRLISTKYEWLAKHNRPAGRMDACMN